MITRARTRRSRTRRSNTTGTGSRPTPAALAARLAINEDDQRVARWRGGHTTIHRVDAILGDCSLEHLRKRKSFKWRTYSPRRAASLRGGNGLHGLAEPISATVRAALASATPAIPELGELGEVYASFAASQAPGWHPGKDWVFAVPDVMTGIVEVLDWPPLAARIRRGDQPAGLRAVLLPARASSARRIVQAPLRGRRRQLRPRPGRARPCAGRAWRQRVPALQPPQPGRPGLDPRSARRDRRAVRPSRRPRPRR